MFAYLSLLYNVNVENKDLTSYLLGGKKMRGATAIMFGELPQFTYLSVPFRVVMASMMKIVS